MSDDGVNAGLRLAEVFLKAGEEAERHIGRDAVLAALLSAAIIYATRHKPDDKVAELLRRASAKLERGEQPRTVN